MSPPPTDRWFVKLDEGVVPKSRFDQVVPLHLAWLRQLEHDGHCPSSGYWGDRRGLDGAGGMLLFRAAHWEEALALAGRDPLVQQGCVRWTLHEWCLVFRSGTTTPDPMGSGEIPAPHG